MNRLNGRSISRLQHIRQSITDIITTPIGSRVHRRQYGSDVFELLDKPQNAMMHLLLQSAIVVAILRNEPRVKLKSVRVSPLDMTGKRKAVISYAVNGQDQEFELPI